MEMLKYNLMKNTRENVCNIELLQIVYLENINLVLAFIINIISQLIELLNISSAFIV